MHALPADSDVPWHRVINAQGRISLSETAARIQAALLEQEGVTFDARGRIDLKRFGYKPRVRTPRL
jgi:methylated-DNA-protein-cysteine methyltransferase-like protein